MKIFENYLNENGNCELRCVREASGGYNSRHAFNTPSDIALLLDSIFYASRLAEEHSWLLCMDSKCHIIGVFELAKGTVNSCDMSPRELFIRALLSGSTNCIVAHNHPSGNPQPSENDIQITKKIREAGDIIGIQLLDHIIIGHEYHNFTYFSFANDSSF